MGRIWPDFTASLFSSKGERTLFSVDVHFPKMDVKISLHESCCSNQSLRGEPLTSFPNRLRSVLRWTSKHESAGRLRWTSNRAKLPFYRIQRGSGDWSGILMEH